MRWGFSDALVFAAVMTMRDVSNEKNNRLIKTHKFYQECYERIAGDSLQAFDVVTNVVRKASRRYTPGEIVLGSKYLALYAFSLVIERQGKTTSEQSKIINMYFANMSFPFSQSAYLSAAKTRSETGDFRKVISISRNYAGSFWVNFFRALYKSGTQKDLQDVVDCMTSMIVRFSVLGNPNSSLAPSICADFVESVNHQIKQVREISIKEIDWLGVIPISERLKEMKTFYESLIDNSNITDEMSKDELLPLLELLVLNCIYDVVMMTKQPKAIKLQMMNDAVALSGIQTDITPEEYAKEIENNTEMGGLYKAMFSSGSPLGTIWLIILTMGGQTDRTDEAIALTSDLLSILIQIENFLDEKYDLFGTESIAENYMSRIIEQIVERCK